MAGNSFSLRDDEDDLDSWLSDQAAGAEMSLATVPDVAPNAQRAPVASAQELWQPTYQQRDPALQKQWQDAESSMLARSQYNPREYGLGEVLRDNSGVLIAGLLSAFSKDGGRSLPSLVQAAGEQNRYYEGQRRADAQAAGDFALRARAQKSTDLTDQLRIKQLQNEDRRLAQQDQRIDLANRGEGRREGEFGRKYDPTNPQVMALKEQIVNASGGRVTMDRLEGLDSGGLQSMAHAYNLQFDSANTGQKARDEAQIAGATSSASSNARNAADTRWAPALGAARGVGEARANEITRPGEVRTAGEVRAATETAGNEANAGRESVKAQTEFAEKNEKLLRAREGLSAVVGRTQNGAIPEGLDFKSRALNAIPGGGNMISDAASLNIQDLESAANSIMRDDSGAAIGVKEGAKGMLDALGSPTLSPEKKWLAVQNFQRRLDNQIRGKASRPDDVQAVLDRQGIDLNVNNPRARAGAGGAQSRAPAQPGTVRAQQPDRGEDGGMQQYTFRGPKGKTFTRNMTQQQMQTFANSNPDWTVY